MGSPRQTFAGETRSSRQCHAGGQGQPRDGVPPKKDISWPSETASTLPLSWRRRGEGLGRREARIVFLPKIFIEDKKISPTPKRPNTFRSVVDLSTTVFQDELFKKLKPSKKEKKTWSLPSLSEEQEAQQSVGFQAQSSQDYLSYPPAYSLRGREKALSNKYEKLVVSRLENLA